MPPISLYYKYINYTVINYTVMKKLIQRIIDWFKNFVTPKKYNITKDTGVFEYVVHEQIDKVPAGKLVIVERTSELAGNMTNPMIKVVDSDNKHIDVLMTKTGQQWQFIMPESDVIIYPTAKRKFR